MSNATKPPGELSSHDIADAFEMWLQSVHGDDAHLEAEFAVENADGKRVLNVKVEAK